MRLYGVPFDRRSELRLVKVLFARRRLRDEASQRPGQYASPVEIRLVTQLASVETLASAQFGLIAYKITARSGAAIAQ